MPTGESMFMGRPVGDVGTAVVPDDREGVVAEYPHQLDDVGGHRPLGVRRVIIGAGWLAGQAVPTKIRTAHRMTPDPGRRHPVPRRVGTRVSMQEQHGRAGAAMRTRNRTSPTWTLSDNEVLKHASW